MTSNNKYYLKYKQDPEFCRKANERTQTWRRSNPERFLYSNARVRAAKANLEFSIDLEDIKIPETCPLLGVPLIKAKGIIDNTPSLDRIDNSKGYIKGNVWVISFKANRMKNTATLEELNNFAVNWIKFNQDIK